MPEFTHLFNAGKMNKDLDERLVPQGEYRDALNLDLANSENGNSGSLQNVEGNLELRGMGIGDPCDGSGVWTNNYIDSLSNPVCIGSIRNPQTEQIYWFIAAQASGTGKWGVSVIAEYDQTTNTIRPVLVDTKGILKFNPTYLITGINVIDKFLFWTDNQTEPKKINIEKFKIGSTNFVTHTKIPRYDQEAEVYLSNLAGQPDFLEEDITVIKKSPINPPSLNIGASKFGADIPGTGVDFLRTEYGVSEQQNFTYIRNTTQDPPPQPVPIDTYGQYIANITEDPNFYANSTLGANWNGEITFDLLAPPSYGIVNGQPVWQDGDILSLKASYIDDFNNIYEYQARFLIVPNGVNGDSITVQIQSISSDVKRFFDEEGDDMLITWEVVLEEKTPLFEYNFPRFAYRWKYIDNEYSTFSPFTSVAFIPNKFEYISSDGYNIGMTNNVRKLLIENLEWGSEEVVELDILYKTDGSNAVYVVDTIKRNDYTLQTGQLQSNFEIKNELIGSIVESNQILRPWDNVPLKAKSQEVIGNRIVYANYMQNYTVGTVNLDTQILSSPHPSRQSEYLETGSATEYVENIFTGDAEPSLKSIRTYQVGVVYKDEFGRETPVFSSQDSSTYIDISNSCEVTRLIAKISTPPPPFATHYKYFVKETSTPYYNLALDRFYPAEDGNVWLSFPSSERNKIDEETYLILKKQHDNSNPVKDLNRYKVLSIKNEAPDFVSNFSKTLFSGTVELLSEAGPGFLTVRVNGPSLETNPNFGNNLTSANKVIFEKGGFETNEYGIEKAGSAFNSGGGSNPVTFSIKLKEPLAGDASWMANLSAGDNIDITIFVEEPKNLPEFEGRFFAKINRNFAFDENIIKTFTALQKRYVILDEIKPFIRTSQGETNANNFKYFWLDTGNRHTNSCFPCSCGSDWGRFQSQGPGGWGGVGTSLNTLMRENYKPPMQHAQWFGYSFVGRQNGYIDDFSGTALAGFNQMSGAYFDAGSYIRFVNNSTGDMSKVYQIQEAYQQGRLGGRIACDTVCCNGYDNQAQDQRVAFLAKLNEPLVESWFPSSNGDTNTLIASDISMQIVTDVYDGDNKILTSNNPAVFETEPKESADLDLYYEASKAFDISQHGVDYDPIDWYNVYSFGNGAESNRIRDDFNANTISKGVKVSTVLDEPYALEHRGSGFIYSQVYNSTSGINRLNQFIQAEKITKDLNPVHGTIQKLHARDTDLIALCEDKCFRILANKDALFNADGNAQLTGNNAVLGQTVPYAGDYGISKNPESFASYAFRSYFTDKNRGAIIRLSRDGITVISEQGMNDFFSDNLSASNKLIGSYDEDKGLYNITFNSLTPYWRKHLSIDKNYNLTTECLTTKEAAKENLVLETTVSFDETTKGWTSRKSFIPESGISLNNTYYTFKGGLIWEHGLNTLYNNFYGQQYFSTVNLLINDSPQAVKGYAALNYSGTQARELEYEYNNNWYSIAEVNAGSFVPTAVQVKKEGWYSNFVRTNLESGEIKEFENKEGKYFNYIKALEVCKKGSGIGTGDVDPTNQDYFLSSGLSCLGKKIDCSGTPVPDTLINGWYQWNMKGTSASIITESTDQSAKCVIEDFHKNLSGNYSLLNSIDSDQFIYVFSDGISVGTQMYNPVTLEPINQAGTYLFINNLPLGETPSAPALDPGNSATVPDNYSIVMVGSDGIIDSVTQYNTIPTCDVEPDMGPLSLGKGYYNNVQSYSTSGTITDVICGLKNSMQEWFGSPLEKCGITAPPKPNCKSQGWFSKSIYWYSSQSAELEAGTTIYTLSGITGLYTPYADKIGLYREPTGGAGIPYQLDIWEDLSTFPAAWNIIETDSNGVITAITQINTISDPTCP